MGCGPPACVPTRPTACSGPLPRSLLVMERDDACCGHCEAGGATRSPLLLRL
jgi:hypothetical protein